MRTVVLITNYNKGQFITKCINSCLYQSFRPDEILVFDDASNDDSKKNLQKFRKKIKLISNKNKKFKNPSKNQIYGIINLINKTKCELVFLLDSDDFFYKKKIKNIRKIFLNNKKLNFVQNSCNVKKKLNFFRSWPDFYPTSTIVFKKSFFINFLKKNKDIFKYNFLEIDAMLSIYAYLNFEYKILNNKYSYYRPSTNGINAYTKKFSKKWWFKRNEAFLFFKKNRKFNHKINFIDCFITSLIVKLLKCLKH